MDESTQVMCLAVKVDQEPPRLWVPEKWSDLALQNHISIFTAGALPRLLEKATTITAHNCEFEQAIWEHARPLDQPHRTWRESLTLPPLPFEKLRDSAAKAAMHALPRALGDCANAINAPVHKDADGYFAMMRLCKPRKGVFNEDPADLLKLFRYCLQDVNAEAALDAMLRDLPPEELAVWRLDQIINARGMYVDVAAATTMIEMTKQHEANLLTEFSGLTKGKVASPRQVQALLRYVTAANTELADMSGMTKADVKAALENGKITSDTRRLLEIRQSLAKASVAKYQAPARSRSADSRVRSCFMYHGASTGRWTGKGFQPHNLPREGVKDPDSLYSVARSGPEAVSDLFGDPMFYASRAVRSLITAAPGNELTWADFNAVESRVLNWEAGEERALQAYRDGRDMYQLNADSIHGSRQVGKVMELALGYQGGMAAFKKMAVGYNVAVVGDGTIPADVRTGTVAITESQVKAAIKTWRESHPRVVAFWKALDNTAKAAIRQPGSVQKVARVAFRVFGDFLCLRLASGRVLYYYKPAIAPKTVTKDDGTTWETEEITFMGVDGTLGSPTYGKWARIGTYGGKLCENIVQATARDLLAAAMLRIEAAGYPVVLHVHDEVVSEHKIGFGSVEDYVRLMCELPKWATGLPIAAEGQRARRYRK